MEHTLPVPPAQPTAAATPSGGAHEATPAAGRTTRSHRGRGGRGKRNAVTIVLPPAVEAAPEEAAGVASAVDASPVGQPLADAALSGTAQPEIVPVREIQAEEAATSAPLAQAEPHPEAALPEAHTAGGPTRRYRFERRAPAAAQHRPAASARPERLSGRFAASFPGAPGAAPEMAPSAEAVAEQPAAESVSARIPTLQPVAEPLTREVTALPSEAGAGAAPEAIVEQPAEAAGEETHEAAARRRRRRRRRPGAEEGEAQAHVEQPETALAPREGGNGFAPPYTPAELEEGYPPYAPYIPGMMPGAREPFERAQPPQPGWSISQAQQQISRPASPFGAPEPSFPHGFGPQPRGVAQPYHEPLTRPTRTEREALPISPSQLTQAISNAIAQQTDKLILELRRQVATPPTITVAMPPMQSTERVGVFVDVANLLYSARNMRMAIDFGRLLEFLRGNRRLIRAHAYAPTSPEPNADQAFLSAVKGVGYRITTKNYKTFASGAKKADLDLDMCMDIVRLVDAGAIDTLALVSGDSDFLPVLEWCSDRGLRIEVAAFEDAVSAVLRQSCDLFVNLSLVPDIRA